MKRRHWLVFGVIFVTLSVLFIAVGKYTIQPVLLEPSGTIGVHQRDLLVGATIIMSIVALPVFVLLGFISWKYRATNKKAAYKPAWQSHKLLEAVWWGIPLVIVVVLSIIAWRSSHQLDPYRPLEGDNAAVEVQVVSLQWKWLFLYPKHGVASINELIIPEQTPIGFSIAADSPMNSFWIPELGGQVYAMNGMTTSLHLEANRIGEFRGLSSNISGEGFADMKFTVRSVAQTDFDTLLREKRQSSATLDRRTYDVIATPGTVTEPVWYRLDDTTLFDQILAKYMPDHSSSEAEKNATLRDMNHSDGGHE